LEVKDAQEHVSLLQLLAMSWSNKLLAQELVTAIGVIARHIGHDKFADEIKCRDYNIQGQGQKDTCLQLSITNHSPNKMNDC